MSLSFLHKHEINLKIGGALLDCPIERDRCVIIAGAVLLAR